MRPRAATVAYMMLIGGGGGGSAGATGGAGTNRGGGGGGGSSAVSIGVFPLALLPDTLYVYVGRGGAGGSGVGSSGELSYVTVTPDTLMQDVVLASGTAAAGGSTSTGGGVAGGNAGAAGTVALTDNMLFSSLGVLHLFAGQAGAAGGSPGSIGVNISLSNFVAGGCGGAGVIATGRDGGALNNSSTYLTDVRPAAAVSGGPGSSGPMLWKPFFPYPGHGGASSNTSVGGDGGSGGYGCGGGGGGGGITGGPGGRGGDGIVVIYTW